MASQYLLFALACVSFLSVGCNHADPVWELPCEERPGREVIPGTGEGLFRLTGDEPARVEYGSQGGSHVWFAVRMRGFGPDAAVQFGLVDPDDPAVVYSGPLYEHVELEYNPGEEASEVTGLFAFLGEYDDLTGTYAPHPSGKAVLFWADVTDACTPEPVHGEAVGEVE